MSLFMQFLNYLMEKQQICTTLCTLKNLAGLQYIISQYLPNSMVKMFDFTVCKQSNIMITNIIMHTKFKLMETNLRKSYICLILERIWHKKCVQVLPIYDKIIIQCKLPEVTPRPQFIFNMTMKAFYSHIFNWKD